MAKTFLLSRREFLIGCSVAASPLLTPVTFAAAPGENRLVVIVLRGAMDGMDVLRPVGDPALLALRPGLAAGAAADPLVLDGFYALHPALSGLMPLWQKGELGFATAVATPYRTRSHFEAQDALESGTGDADGPTAAPAGDGWLNRAVGRLGGFDADTAVMIGQEPMLIMEGAAPVRHWLPVDESRMSDQGESLLMRLYDADPAFAAAWAETQALRDETTDRKQPGEKDPLGRYVAERLNAESRIATFSVAGWDTHHNQTGALPKRLGPLADLLLTLRSELGRHWAHTAVIALTEFGRTAHENGTGGTDHGTGGTAILAGGALKGGKVWGQWPGLDEASLLDRRDLMPTSDVRGYAARMLHEMFGIGQGDLEAAVFPGLSMQEMPQLTL
ncbi:MAG: DUF1501 domain-containing protein [Paracoccaceae bacterium]